MKLLSDILTYPFRAVLKATQGKAKYQKFYRKLHNASLRGMNFGLGDDLARSGEMALLKMVAQQSGEHEAVVFDVGANTGNYSQAVLETFGAGRVRIYAFEPAQAMWARLAERFKGAPNVRVLPFALGEKSATAELFAHESLSGLSSLHERRLAHHHLVLAPKETVTVVPLDRFCADNAINRISLLKLDVEGHEFSVLQGAERMLAAGAIENIQFEFGGCNIDARTFFQDFFYLLKDRYRLYRIVQDGVIEIPSYSEAEEIFLTINYFARRKEEM